MNETVIIVEHIKKEFSYIKKVDYSWYKKPFLYFFPSHGTIKSVDDVSFSVKKGERVALIGPNGAGKSTIIKILVGIMYPTSGTMSILDMNPCCDRQKLAYHIGVVFGHCSQLWYHLTVWQSFELLSPMYDIDPKVFKQRFNHLVDKFKIGHLLCKPLRQLSLGERMRCEIIASFLHMPKILFLDEPTASIDTKGQTDFYEFLKELNKTTTIVVVSHDFMVLSSYIKSIACVNEKLFFHDRPELTKDMLEMAYHCPVELIAHGMPHRVLHIHEDE